MPETCPRCKEPVSQWAEKKTKRFLGLRVNNERFVRLCACDRITLYRVDYPNGTNQHLVSVCMEIANRYDRLLAEGFKLTGERYAIQVREASK